MHSTHSLFLIDDSAENAFAASQADPPVKVLLFGQYPWNRIVYRPQNHKAVDDMTFVEREEAGLLEEGEKRRESLIKEAWLPSTVERVDNWEGVVSWVEKWEKDNQ